MAKSGNIGKYPPGMMDVLEAVCETGKPCPIHYPDAVSAKRERFQFYGLVRALRLSGHTLANKATQLTFSITGPSKNTLIITMGNPLNNDFYTKVAENHLEKAGDPPAQ